jgi:ribosomal protein S18 acetylase RimI-like enzyme
MKIRKANIGDLKIITNNNLLLAFESENKKLNYDLVYNGVKNLIDDDKKGFYLVVEHNKIIIGQLIITYEWSDWNNKTIWWIQSVYVDKSYRRMGVFKNLLNTIKKIAKGKNIINLKLYVHKDNKNAKKVYEKIGMKIESYNIYQLEIKG